MLQKKLAKNGIKFGYHNHSREFYPTPDGVVFEDELIKNTDIELEIDTFWLYNAGFDVIQHASNHTLDRGEKGILHSIDLWKNFKNQS